MILRVLIATLTAVVLLPATGRAQLTADDAIAQLDRARKHLDAKEYDKAQPILERLLTEAPRIWGEESTAHASILQDAAFLYEAQNQRQRAEILYRRALGILEKVQGADHPDLVYPLLSLGQICGSMRQFNQAESHLRRALAIRETKSGRDHYDVVAPLHFLGLFYADQQQGAKAEPLLKRALRICEEKHGVNNAETARIMNDLSQVYYAMGEFGRVEALAERALKARETTLGPDHEDVGESLMTLADVYQRMGRFGKAEPMIQRALAIYESKLQPDDTRLAYGLLHQAGLYRDTGRYAKAEPIYRRARALLEAKLAPDDPNVTYVMEGLGSLYERMGQFEAAKALYQQSLKIREAKLPANHPDRAWAMNSLAGVYLSQKEFALAEPLYQKALALHEARAGTDHVDVACALHNLGSLYQSMGKPDQAEPILIRSLKLHQAKLPPDNPCVGNCLNTLGLVYLGLGKYAQAEPLFQQALDLRRARFGKGHPETVSTLRSMAELRLLTGRHAEAVRLMHQAMQLSRVHEVQVLPALTETEQLNFLRETARLDRAISLARAGRLGEENALRSAAWLINGKAVAQQSLAEQILLTREADTPEARKLLDDLASVRRELSKIALDPGNRNLDEIRRQKDELVEREKRLAGQLHRHDLRTTRDDPWVDADEVARRLPAGSAYVDFVRYHAVDFRKTYNDAAKPPARYAAWIMKPGSDVQIVDLGDAEPIERAVAGARRTLKQAPTEVRDVGEPQAAAEAHKALADLARRVLQPLQAHIDDAERWIFCPDGNLWLVPWAALPIDGSTFAIEKHTIHLVISGRDLILDPLKLDLKAREPLVVADPDFDLAPVGIQRRPLVAPDPANPRLRAAGLQLDRVSRLPHTAIEGELVADRLAKWLGSRPRTLFDKEALAGTVRATKAPRVLVLATHGFFLPEPEAPAGHSIKPKLENPLMRCGLLLAGSNNARTARADQDNGVLTGLDVVGLDLRGTELVVLSACETGLGVVNNGEGVAGLRQAFQLAGAESVMASLWAVPDRDTAMLMVRVFDELAAGKGRAEALQSAQRAQIARRRKVFGAAHPFFWAAFTITGPGR